MQCATLNYTGTRIRSLERLLVELLEVPYNQDDVLSWAHLNGNPDLVRAMKRLPEAFLCSADSTTVQMSTP